MLRFFSQNEEKDFPLILISQTVLIYEMHSRLDRIMQIQVLTTGHYTWKTSVFSLNEHVY